MFVMNWGYREGMRGGRQKMDKKEKKRLWSSLKHIEYYQ
jgi:hypothetical protein